MTPEATRTVVERYMAAFNRADWATAASLVAPDFVEEYPQSGEVIRGRDNFRGVLEHMPGSDGGTVSLAEDSIRIVGAEDRWVMTPTYVPLRVEGSGDHYTVSFRITYADGSVWHIVSVLQLRNGLISRATTYFGPRFEPAEWRAPFVEVDPRQAGGRRTTSA